MGTRKASEEQESVEQKGDEKDSSCDVILRAPTKKLLPFTLSQLKKAIPPHCFNRSILRSFSYVLNDLFIAGLLFYLALTVLPTLPSPFHLIAWPLYWFAQGFILGSVWVIAHECGHHAFSNFPVLDNVVGFVLHSFLLVPFFSWKYSHRRHHSNTGSLNYDEVFVPKTRFSVTWFNTMCRNPFGRVMYLIIALTLGWPMYLLFSFSGRPYEHYACHFDPYGPIYNDQERVQIFVSDAGIITVLYLLYRLASAFTISWLIKVYIIPLLLVNGGLVFVTFLHHTHQTLPHYDSSEWNWLRGALSTVDRDYGFFNYVLHNITNTHVTHHLFPSIPHYHAMEATKAIRPLLGDYYRFDNTPVVKAIWREASECIFVEAELDKGKPKGVFWYRNNF